MAAAKSKVVAAADFKGHIQRAYDTESVTRVRALTAFRTHLPKCDHERAIEDLESYARAHARRRVLEETGREVPEFE